MLPLISCLFPIQYIIAKGNPFSDPQGAALFLLFGLLPTSKCILARKLNIYNYGQTNVLPGEVHFDCEGPVFYAFWDVGQLATWLTRFVSKTTQNLKP